MKKLICFAFSLLLINHLICFAERSVKYNSEKQQYEVRDEETGELIKVLGSIEKVSNFQEKYINFFPYQQGWPVQTPSAVYNPLTIGELTGDDHLEVFSLTTWDGYFIYDYLGNIIQTPDYGRIAAFKDIDFDGLNEIIGAQRWDPPYCTDGCGANVSKWDGTRLNGFPNPPKTGFVGASIEDINRDGNYEIAFAASEHADFYNYNLGMYVLGSWGGLLPGFPVPFPYQNYEPLCCAGYSYASPSIGDFNDDGMMELAINTANRKLYVITSDGSHYRNWPVVFYYGGAHPVSLPVLGDIDNDGKLELAITDDNVIKKLFVFNDDASLVAGFPVSSGNGPTYRNPSLADVNKDGKLELYVLSLCDRLIAFSNDGKILPGWPIFLRVNNYAVSFNHFPSIADIDGDGEMEIIAAGGTCKLCSDGVIVAYNFDGTMVNGFPIIEPFNGFIDIGPTLADLDNDGDIEICTGSEYCGSEYPAHIYCYDLTYPYDETKIAWNNYAHDNQHTARYVNPAVKHPVVRKVEPDSSSYKGGHMVKITGKNFLSGAKIFFDGVPSAEVQVLDSSTIFAKVPPHKPCFRYINDISVSPYQLSYELANQAVIEDSGFNIQSSKLKDIENLKAINSTNFINSANQNGCIVNIVVAHPSPDQREGILRAGFIYTGYEQPKDDIVLFVSKYSPMGTFENNGANWMWMSDKGLWNIIDDDLNCIAKPYPSGHKAMYYGNKGTCNYDTGERNVGYLEMPFIKVESTDARIRFRYYRDVEYNPMRNADEFRVEVWYKMGATALWVKDSTEPSEKAWTQSPELPLGNWAGKEVRIIFWFDTKDELDNNYGGVAIDNVEITGASWSPWAETSGEVILNWTGGLPKYFVYRGTSPDFINNPPELRAYTPFNYKYENSLNDYKSYYYKIR